MNIARDDRPQSLTCTQRIESSKASKMPSNDNQIFQPVPVNIAHLSIEQQQLLHIATQLATECYRQQYPSTALIKKTLLGIDKLRGQQI